MHIHINFAGEKYLRDYPPKALMVCRGRSFEGNYSHPFLRYLRYAHNSLRLLQTGLPLNGLLWPQFDPTC